MEERDRLFIFEDAREGMVLTRGGGLLEVPEVSELASFGDCVERRGYVHLPSTSGDVWVLAKKGWTPPDGWQFVSRRNMPFFSDGSIFERACGAYQMMAFEQRTKFCGICGGEMEDSDKERARRCTKCGAPTYPSPAPAVIVAIEKGETLLLAHNPNFPEGLYGVLAGFVEPGESFETTMHREIFEESNIAVKNIRYFTSQTWAFPNSVMAAFFAEWESGEPRAADGELTDVRWFTRDEARAALLPPNASVARRLIDDWLDREKK